MLSIECPWCGTRDEPEFTYGGETGIARPPQGCSDEEWSQYLYFRSNPQGEHAERWCHTHGCGRWFNLIRDTVTHEIKATCRIGDRLPHVT